MKKSLLFFASSKVEKLNISFIFTIRTSIVVAILIFYFDVMEILVVEIAKQL